MMDTLTFVRDNGRILIQDARRRRLGSLFLPIRRLYVYVLPAALIGAGLAGLSLQNDAGLILNALVIAAVGVFLGYDLLSRGAPIRISTVFAFTLALGYGLGTVNTWLTLPRSGRTLAQFFNIEPSNLAGAEALIGIGLALMLVLGELFEKPIFGEEFRLRFTNRDIALVTLGAIFRAATLATGHAVGFASTAGLQSGRIGAVATLSNDIESPLFALTACMAFNAETRLKRWYLYGLSAVWFFLAFPMGRRLMIYSVVLVILAVRLGIARIHASVLKQVAVAICLGTFLYVANLGYYYVRVAGYSEKNPTLSERISDSISLIEDKKSSKVEKAFTSNVEGRTFILTFPAELLGYAEVETTAHGVDMIDQFQKAMPTALFPGKDAGFTEEALANSQFGAYWPDQPNSVFTSGIVDFGIAGLLFYPLLFIVLLRGWIELVTEFAPPFLSCYVALMVIAMVLEPEQDISSYFLVIRESVLTGGVVWLFRSLPVLQLGRTKA
jgi:hypothetical protein